MNRFDPLRKLMHVDEAIVRYARQSGTVFVDGVFDVLHRGHVTFLAEARQLGDRLVVAIHGDAAGGPGQGRPLNRERNRAVLVAGLESVDAVFVTNEVSSTALLSRLKPAVHAQYGRHDLGRRPETPLMRSWGGHAIALPFAEDFPITALAERIRGMAQPVAFSEH